MNNCVVSLKTYRGEEYRSNCFQVGSNESWGSDGIDGDRIDGATSYISIIYIYIYIYIYIRPPPTHIHPQARRKHFKSGTPSGLNEISITADNDGPEMSPRNICVNRR